uniref:Uncharacterized protein n=1 Tax=Bradyrhizobium quebecense TaxID=2748629 RepID=A0A974AH47_9BRAD
MQVIGLKLVPPPASEKPAQEPAIGPDGGPNPQLVPLLNKTTTQPCVDVRRAPSYNRQETNFVNTG